MKPESDKHDCRQHSCKGCFFEGLEGCTPNRGPTVSEARALAALLQLGKKEEPK